MTYTSEINAGVQYAGVMTRLQEESQSRSSAKLTQVSPHAIHNVFACPDCRTEVIMESGAILSCPACKNLYHMRDGVRCFDSSDEDDAKAVQAMIYDRKEAAGETLNPEVAPRLGRYPDLLLTYREHGRQVRAMKLRPGSRVLDLGCSTGTFLRSLRREMQVETYGLDVSLASLTRAAQLCPEAEWSHGAADALPFRGGVFDAVFAFDVLEHIANYEAALREIVRVLRPGGQALFHVPVSDIRGSFDSFWKKYRPERHRMEQEAAGHFPQNMHSKSELIRACAGARLSLQRFTLFNVMFQNIFDYRIRHGILARAFNGRRAPFSVYHAVVAPAIELFTVLPDRLIGSITGIGASAYFHVRRDPTPTAP